MEERQRWSDLWFISQRSPMTEPFLISQCLCREYVNSGGQASARESFIYLECQREGKLRALNNRDTKAGD